MAVLKKGYSAKSLSKGLVDRQDISAQIEELETVLGATVDKSERLAAWVRLIVKTLETSKRRDKTLEVLERCKEEYLKDAEFHNDERYIGVWLKLAEFARDPIDTFTFMHTNKIGALCASFYVAWADVLERRNRVGDAEKVLTAGIRRKAQPADDLLAKRKHFETRQFLKVISKAEEQPAAQATAPAGRPRAAVAKTTKSSGVVKKSGQSLSAVLAKSAGGMGNFQIFVDENCVEAQTPFSQVAETPASGWATLPGEIERVKENSQKPERWSDNSYEQKFTTGPVEVDFPIWVDEEFDEPEPLEADKGPFRS